MATGPFHHAVDFAFGRLLVEAIEAQAVGCGRACGTGARDLLDGVDGVDEYAVCRRLLAGEQGSYSVYGAMWGRYKTYETRATYPLLNWPSLYPIS